MPKTRSFRFVVPGTPEEVRERLAAQTHIRMMPMSARAVGRSSLPLAGRVDAQGGFNVASSERDLFRRMLPTARGSIVEGGLGTLVEGEAGLPPWVTYYLRAICVAMLLAVFGGLGAVAMDPSRLAPTIGLLLFTFAAVFTAIGVHVSNANAKVDGLIRLVEGAIQPAAGASAEAVDAAERPTSPGLAERVRA